MRTILLAILALTAAATAARADCKPTGKSVLEVTQKTSGTTMSTTSLYANGAWQYEQPATTTPTKQAAAKREGCLDTKDAATAKADLAAIDWTVTHARIHCMAVSPNTTDYSTGGKPRFTQKLCGVDSLAAPSAEKLAALVQLLGTATAPNPKH
jgi:hypothetical protein